VTSIAASNGFAEGYVAAAIWMAVILAGVITWLKGHRLSFLLGIVTIGLTWVVAAFLLAKPESFWARHAYGERRRERARSRYA
jgi:hypothetical protein